MVRAPPWILAACLLWAAPAQAGADNILTMQGLGKVRIGMTIAAAEQALGSKLTINTVEDPSGECEYAYQGPALDHDVSYMVVHGTIQRIEVWGGPDSRVRTPEGIRRGASEAAMLRAYGRRVTRQTDDYDQPRLVLKDEAGHSSMIFTLENGRVTWILAGNYPALGFSEGCL
jgi:hypothetical protein